VIANGPDLVRGVLGGVQMKIQGVIADFVATRMTPPQDAFASAILAGAVGGAVQSALRHWFVNGGDLPATVARGLDVLEHLGGDPNAFA
jgi:hypothetical protein